MPSGYLHQLCAEQAAKAAGASKFLGSALIMGAQGPDPLFALGIFPLKASSRPGKEGGVIHKQRTGAHLMALLQLAKEAGDVERAYALGFLTHYALDSTVHPFVYAHSFDRAGRYSSSLHMRLEKHWDALYFRRGGGRGTPVFMPGIAEAAAHWHAIAALWSRALERVFPELSLTEARLLGAFADARRICRLTHSNLGVKYSLIWCLERIAGKPALLTSQITPRFPSRKDIENSAHKPWHSVSEPERERTEGLAELFEAAVRRAEELIRAALAFFDGEMDARALSRIVGNVGYDTGLPLSAEGLR